MYKSDNYDKLPFDTLHSYTNGSQTVVRVAPVVRESYKGGTRAENQLKKIVLLPIATFTERH